MLLFIHLWSIYNCRGLQFRTNDTTTTQLINSPNLAMLIGSNVANYYCVENNNCSYNNKIEQTKRLLTKSTTAYIQLNAIIREKKKMHKFKKPTVK